LGYVFKIRKSAFFMAEYNFLQRKMDVLKKFDKSHEGTWDEHIVKLCNKINSKENYYTTSSCSGRILLMVDQDKKSSGLFLWKSHEKIDLSVFRKFFESFKEKFSIKFKCEPPIIHVVCKTINDAEELLEKGFKSGWKKSGIISLRKNIVLELHGTEKLEFPILKDGKILVEDQFLKLIVEKSNKKLEKGWDKIVSLEKLI